MDIIENLSSSANSTIVITDLYDTKDLWDEGELISQYVNSGDYEKPLTVRTMTSEEAKNIVAGRGKKIFDAYEKDASKRQKTIVAKKIKTYDFDRVVVLYENRVIDGNHHIIASILTGNPLKYVDLSEWDNIED